MSPTDRELCARFRVSKKGFTLDDVDPRDTGGIDKDDGETLLAQGVERLSELQERLHAQDRWAVLLLFQGERGPHKRQLRNCLD